MITAIVLLAALLLVTAVSAFCFFLAFYSPKRKNEDHPLPVGEVYEPYYEDMIRWQNEVDRIPSRAVEIKSRDGLTLRGRYFEYSPDAPIELMLHGYRGSWRSDLCGGILRCFRLGRSVLAVDQRGCGTSDGSVICFGIKESLDCLDWARFIVKEINPDARIILTGVSMGAATVMIASELELPPNVSGVLADCGYTSPKEIIKRVSKGMKLPPALIYPFVKLGARLFGGFDIDSCSPRDSLTRARVPVIFIHGDTDDFVPYEMSEENYAHCTSRKRLVKVKGAGHGLAYAVDPKLYLDEISSFFKEEK